VIMLIILGLIAAYIPLIFVRSETSEKLEASLFKQAIEEEQQEIDRLLEQISNENTGN